MNENDMKIVYCYRFKHKRAQSVLPRVAISVRGGGRHAGQAAVLQGSQFGAPARLRPARPRRLPLHTGETLQGENIPSAL